MIADKLNNLLIHGAAEDNMLHVTSFCPLDCVFCSNKYNPPGLDIFYPGHLPRNLIGELIGLLDGRTTIRIGESTTRIVEGEPFAYPDIFSVLEEIRVTHPHTPVAMVTGASLLKQNEIKRLKELMPVFLKISFNICGWKARRKFMGQAAVTDMALILAGLQKEEIPFSLTTVAVPHLTGWQELGETLKRGACFQPQEITVFRQGYTDFTPFVVRPPHGQDERLDLFIDELSRELAVPVLVEPPFLTDLKARVEGVYAGSAAARAGLKRGDIILKVDGNPVRSRVHAYTMLKHKVGEASLVVERRGVYCTLKLTKEKGGVPAGALFHRDLSPGFLDTQRRAVVKKRTGLITSNLAGPLIESLVGERGCVLPVDNTTFGGSIGTTGLLTVADILKAAREIEAMDLEQLLIPANIFDYRGHDLRGCSIDVLAEQLSIPLRICLA